MKRIRELEDQAHTHPLSLSVTTVRGGKTTKHVSRTAITPQGSSSEDGGSCVEHPTRGTPHVVVSLQPAWAPETPPIPLGPWGQTPPCPGGGNSPPLKDSYTLFPRFPQVPALPMPSLTSNSTTVLTSMDFGSPSVGSPMNTDRYYCCPPSGLWFTVWTILF
jgi:hypothetical protein